MRGKGVAVLLTLVLLFSGCGGDKEKSRSEVMAVNAVKTEETEAVMKQTKITSAITDAASEIFSEEITSSESADN